MYEGCGVGVARRVCVIYEIGEGQYRTLRWFGHILFSLMDSEYCIDPQLMLA